MERPNIAPTIIIAILLLLSGCSGGGSNPGGSGSSSGGGGGNSNGGGTPALQQMDINRIGARYNLESSLNLISLTRSTMSEVPFLAYVIYDGEGDGEFSYEFECDNPEGSYSIYGNLNEGTGEIITSFQSCEDVAGEVVTDGIMRITVSETSSAFIPTKYALSFESYINTSTTGLFQQSREGTIVVRPVIETTQVASTDIRITNLYTDAYIESDRLKLYGDIPVGLSPSWDQARVTGRINYSTLGYVQLFTGSSLADYLKIAGSNNTSIRMRFLNEDEFIAALDDDGDDISDAYLHASLQDLKGNYGYNDRPFADINDTIQEMTGNPVAISLLGVADPDCDFLDYEVESITQPSGSEFSWSIDENLDLVFNADTSGNYVFNLIIDDHWNGIIEKRINILIRPLLPTVDLEQRFFQFGPGELVEIDLAAGNPEDGPFTYNIFPMYPGMSISDNGILEWQIPDCDCYFLQTTIQFDVYISNNNSGVKIPIVFSISDPDVKHPIVRTGIEVPDKERNIHVGDFDNDGITEILLTDNYNLIYTLEWQVDRYVQDWVFPYEINSPDYSIDAILPLDMDGNGEYEIIVQTGPQIKVIDIKDNRVLSSIDLSRSIEPESIETGRGIKVADLDNDGLMEMLALFGTGTHPYENSAAFLLDLKDFSIIWQTNVLPLGRSMEIGNVDNDSSLEIIFSGGFVFDGTTLNNEWTYSEEFGRDIVTADIDDDGIDEIISRRYYDTPVVYDAVMKSALFDFPDRDNVSSILAVNIDSDPAKEIIIGDDARSGFVTAYDADSGFPVEKWSISTQDYGATSLAVGDADQDGNLEVLWGTGIGISSENSLVVFDSMNLSIDFHNIDPSQLSSPYIGGRPIMDVNGNSKVVFAVRKTDGVYAGGRLIFLDFETGDMDLSPNLFSSSDLNFCIADYDLDDTEEILFASKFGAVRVSAYDPFRNVEERFIVEDLIDFEGSMACGDANGDGYTDIVVIGDNLYSTSDAQIRLYDLFNQTLLWGSTDLIEDPQDIAMVDLDDDNVPEILALYEHSLVVHKKSGSTYVGDVTYKDDAWFFKNIFVDDVDGDWEPEILISETNSRINMDTTRLVVFNKKFNKENSITVDGRISAIAITGDMDNTLLIATSEGIPSISETRSYINFVDLQHNEIVWKSSPILGDVTRDSLHIVQKPGSSKKQLAIGSRDAMYLTQ